MKYRLYIYWDTNPTEINKNFVFTSYSFCECGCVYIDSYSFCFTPIVFRQGGFSEHERGEKFWWRWGAIVSMAMRTWSESCSTKASWIPLASFIKRRYITYSSSISVAFVT
jgi:hypothetical protein